MNAYRTGNRSDAALVLEALADGTRRRTFELLEGGPRAVGDLAERLPVSRPAVSQHLRVLKDAGLVRERREGARRLYSIDPEGIEPLRAYLDRYWGEALQSFKRAADGRSKSKRSRS